MQKIWCIFSVDNNYDQPSNNLVCWFHGKPKPQQISSALGVPDFEKASDDFIIGVVKISRGEEFRQGETDYRLEEVAESKCL